MTTTLGPVARRRPHRSWARRPSLVAASAACAVGLVLAAASPAGAHVDPTPLAVQAGTRVTVQFSIEHGCGSSPTTALAFRLPSGVTDASPVTKAGWTASVNGGEVRFSGGSLDASTPDHFDIAFTAPTTPGTIAVPVVQTCASGSLSWIDVPTAGKSSDTPAPVLKVTAGVPTAADLAPAEHDDHAHDEGGDDGGGGGSGGTIAAVVGVAAVLGAVGGGLVLRRRQRAS